MVDFGGWDMPLSYGSQIEEHHAVRQHAGLFDVSHMRVLDLCGARASECLRLLLANDVARLKDPGKALYSCMLNEAGGILDDLIVYRLDDELFRVVVNAGTAEKDQAWISARAAALGVAVKARREQALLAVQGPEARAHVAALLLPADAMRALNLDVFVGAQIGEWFIARTGYTGEDGFEIMLPAEAAAGLWRALIARGVRCCGLGARDTLRLEAGMNLYGQDMDEQTHPLESGLEWTVAWEPAERQFIGRAVLEGLRAAGTARRLCGLVLEERAVMRAHQHVIVPQEGEGMITSGTFSPTLARSIALARLPAGQAREVQVEVRGKLLPARVVKPPFVRHGRALLQV
jgi:glycine cleavage system T protein (aminomethyltransferase)